MHPIHQPVIGSVFFKLLGEHNNRLNSSTSEHRSLLVTTRVKEREGQKERESGRGKRRATKGLQLSTTNLLPSQPPSSSPRQAGGNCHGNIHLGALVNMKTKCGVGGVRDGGGGGVGGVVRNEFKL